MAFVMHLSRNVVRKKAWHKKRKIKSSQTSQRIPVFTSASGNVARRIESIASSGILSLNLLVLAGDRIIQVDIGCIIFNR